MARYRWALIGGIAAVIVSNYFQVIVAREVGLATDAMQAGRAARGDFALYAGAIMLLTLFMGFFRFLMRHWIIGASRHIEFEFRNDFFAKLQSLTPSFYDRHRTGDLMARATNDLDAVRMVLGPAILQMANSLAILPLALWRMWVIDPRLTLATLVPVAAVPLLVNVLGNMIHRRFRRVQDQFSTITSMVQENLAGVRVVRAFVQEDAEQARFADLNRDYIRLNMRLARTQAALFPALRLLLGVAVVVLLWQGSLEVVRQKITLGQLVEFSLIQLMIFWPLIALGWTVSLFQRGAASMERIAEIMETVPEVLAQPASGAAGRVSHGAIEIRNLSFRYAPGRQLVLKNICLSVPAGGSLGVVGPTGSGKSTLAMLLAHLYRVDRGQIFLDGQDINDIPPGKLRDSVSLVLQETFLFSDTIGRNIGFGAENATEGAIREAAERARIAAEIEALPRGYDTMLGERGINLSGGQKQRVAIARAIIRDPLILILDDALSAVDTETEAAIIESLREVLAARTAIVIAHRISAVMHCDTIIVLEDGRITEQGTHDSLVAAGGLYATLYEKQLLAEAVEAEAD